MERDRKPKITVTKIPEGFQVEYKGKEGIATGIGSTKTDAMRQVEISKELLNENSPLEKNDTPSLG